MSDNMYDNVKTWNPFKGCLFDCVYCVPTFQRQAKRQKHICKRCYRYEPHFHSDRLKSIPSAETIFVAGNGDISFAKTENIMKIIDAIKDHNKRCSYKMYYFQSKDPSTFDRFKNELPDNSILLTTLETDIDKYSDGSVYGDYSKAPSPSKRIKMFKDIDYPKKVITIEPIMEFSSNFYGEIASLNPMYVWLGFNSKPKSVKIPEPTEDETQELVNALLYNGIKVRGKTLRDVDVFEPYP